MRRLVSHLRLYFWFFSLPPLDVDDEYEDEEEQWEDGAEDILEKGENLIGPLDAELNWTLVIELITLYLHEAPPTAAYQEEQSSSVSHVHFGNAQQTQ